MTFLPIVQIDVDLIRNALASSESDAEKLERISEVIAYYDKRYAPGAMDGDLVLRKIAELTDGYFTITDPATVPPYK